MSGLPPGFPCGRQPNQKIGNRFVLVAQEWVVTKARLTQPFEKVLIPNLGEPARTPRISFRLSELNAIQVRCREVDDGCRWVIAMMSDAKCQIGRGCRNFDS